LLTGILAMSAAGCVHYSFYFQIEFYKFMYKIGIEALRSKEVREEEEEKAKWLQTQKILPQKL
jgi:hypothetical protein